MRLAFAVSVKATLRPGAKLGAHVDRQHAEEDGCNLSSMGDAIGRAMRAPTGWRAEVVAQASLSCRCTAIHLLAPYGEVLQAALRPYGVAAHFCLPFRATA